MFGERHFFYYKLIVTILWKVIIDLFLMSSWNLIFKILNYIPNSTRWTSLRILSFLSTVWFNKMFYSTSQRIHIIQLSEEAFIWKLSVFSYIFSVKCLLLVYEIVCQRSFFYYLLYIIDWLGRNKSFFDSYISDFFLLSLQQEVKYDRQYFLIEICV